MTIESWRTLEPNAGYLEGLNKQFATGPDVLLSIRRDGGLFAVQCNAESRTSGPSVTALGRFSTIEEARAALIEEACRWDDEIDEPFDLRGLRTVT